MCVRSSPYSQISYSVVLAMRALHPLDYRYASRFCRLSLRSFISLMNSVYTAFILYDGDGLKMLQLVLLASLPRD